MFVLEKVKFKHCKDWGEGTLRDIRFYNIEIVELVLSMFESETYIPFGVQSGHLV